MGGGETEPARPLATREAMLDSPTALHDLAAQLRAAFDASQPA